MHALILVWNATTTTYYVTIMLCEVNLYKVINNSTRKVIDSCYDYHICVLECCTEEYTILSRKIGGGATGL